MAPFLVLWCLALIRLAEGWGTGQVTKLTGPQDLGNGVVELDDKSFNKFIEDNPTSMVLFYAWWCDWCKKVSASLAEAGEILKAKKAPVILAQIDSSKNIETEAKYDISSYPTMYLFLDGVPHPYEGSAQSKDIAAWLEGHIDTDPVIRTEEELDTILRLSANEPLLLLFDPDSPGREMFDKASRHALHAHFGIIGSDQVLNTLQKKNLWPNNNTTNIVLINPYAELDSEKKAVPFTGSTEEEIVKFAEMYRFPLITDFTPNMAGTLFDDSRLLLIILEDGADLDREAQLEKIVKDVLPYLRNDYVGVRAKKGYFTARLFHVLGFESAEDEPLPSLRVLNITVPEAPVKYRLDSEITPDSLRQFLENVVNGKIKPWMRSEPEPEDPPEQGEVQILVATQFQKLVMETSNDVFVEYYAPWCGHCKQLEPVYSQVAQVLAPLDTIKIMKLDATLNEVPFQLIGYPTMILFTGPPNNRTQTEYHGARRTEEIVRWLSSKAGNPFDAGRFLNPEKKERLSRQDDGEEL